MAIKIDQKNREIQYVQFSRPVSAEQSTGFSSTLLTVIKTCTCSCLHLTLHTWQSCQKIKGSRLNNLNNLNNTPSIFKKMSNQMRSELNRRLKWDIKINRWWMSGDNRGQVTT